MIGYLIPLIVLVVAFGYVFWMFKSGKMGAFTQASTTAMNDVNNNYPQLFAQLKSDPAIFGPIAQAVGGDFVAIAQCKKPQGFLGAAAQTAKDLATGVAAGVIIEGKGTKNLLLIQNDTLHYLECDTARPADSWVLRGESFEFSQMADITIKKGSMTDNLKQGMSFELAGGGESRAEAKNSDLQKLTFNYGGKNTTFFLYDNVDLPGGSDAASSPYNMSPEDLKRMFLSGKLTDQFIAEMRQRGAA